MTVKQTPADAELEALLLDKLPASKHYIRPVIEKMVAAMQAAIDKWGQPAQARAVAEPLDEARRLFDAGWKAAALFCDREDVVADGIIGFGACPQFEAAFCTAPQPVARGPLPKFLALKFHARRDKKATVTLLFPGHEAADAWVRGIKGGQHVE